MSHSIQATPSANAGIQQSKLSSLESADNPASNDDSGGFTAVFASAESETDTAKQQPNENSSELLNELLPKDYLVDGNSLPADEQTAMWQALMLFQSAENVLTNSTSTQLQSINLLDSKGKLAIDPRLLNQDYFNTLSMQNKDAAATLPADFSKNNISMQLAAAQFTSATNEAHNMSMQLAAAQFTPDSNESILLNLSEQLPPVQGTNSILSQSLAATGLGTATQAASTQTQMAPLNLGQNAWETNLGSRLQMMVGQNVQTAEIRLDPPELGTLDIKIKITNDIASVNITSPHAQVREALESSIPRLREMFEETGVALGDVNVGQESFAQEQNSAEEGSGVVTQIAGSDFSDEPVTVIRKVVSDSLLDIYA
ncbi:MAG: flagellar hook-length control protein FliK [Gammaproteobacteria bacterium]|nr:flagellar hook-length control protein FliK [Gammaproteobacteria bacterium]